MFPILNRFQSAGFQRGFRWGCGAVLVCIAVSSAHFRVSHSQETTVAKHLNVSMPTLGGTQLWTDHVIRDGYRIQRNSLTGHHRLLDASDVRRAWGSRADVEAVLNELNPATTAQSEDGKPTVVLLHGLMRTAQSMRSMEMALNEAGYERTVRFSYASTRQSIAEDAAALREVLEGMPSDSTFSFVGHSMGNIVVRHLVGDLQTAGDPKGILTRCESMVMLGPPNQGAAIARRLSNFGVFRTMVGKGAVELGRDFDQIRDHLAVPPFPFLVVAGNVTDSPISNPLTDGEGDFVVSLDEARLDGAATMIEVPVLHSFLMDDAAVQERTLQFIADH
ncbi:MAG: lipase [Planctomycetota bacterium]